MITTIAQSVTPPAVIPGAGTRLLSLMMTNIGTIDLFNIGVNFDSWNGYQAALTDEQKCNFYKIMHLSVMWKVCMDSGLVPGITEDYDRQILQELRRRLSTNIQNKDDVINEYIRFWNDIAAKYASTKNPPFTGIFSFVDFIDVVNDQAYEMVKNSLAHNLQLASFFSTIDNDSNISLNAYAQGIAKSLSSTILKGQTMEASEEQTQTPQASFTPGLHAKVSNPLSKRDKMQGDTSTFLNRQKMKV